MTQHNKPSNRSRGWWVETFVHECPVCGGGETFHERVYDRPKPKDPMKRYHHAQMYDWCNERGG